MDTTSTSRRNGVALRDVHRQSLPPNIEATAAKRRTVALVLAREAGGQRNRAVIVVIVALIHRAPRVLEFRPHVGGTTQTQIRAGSGLKISKDVRKLHSRAHEIVTENFRGLHPLSPVRAAFPRAQGRSTCGIGHDVLQIEERRMGKEERGEAGTRCSIPELRLDDDAEGNLHFEAVPRGVNEPSKTVPRVADVRDEVVFIDLRRYPSPCTDREVRTGNNGNGCSTLSRGLFFSTSTPAAVACDWELTLVFMDETVQVYIVTLK